MKSPYHSPETLAHRDALVTKLRALYEKGVLSATFTIGPTTYVTRNVKAQLDRVTSLRPMRVGDCQKMSSGNNVTNVF